MTPVIILGVSLTGITLLIALKEIEYKRRKTFALSLRQRADRRVLRLVNFFQIHLPTLSRKVWQQMLHHFALHLGTFFLKVVRFVENRLVRFINIIKGKGVIKKKGSASFFIQNVLEHKSELRRERDVHL